MAETKHHHHSREEKLAKAEKICKAVSERSTLASACDSEGIDVRTWTRWVDELSELSELYKKAKETAKETQIDKLRGLAPTAMEILLTNGHETVSEEWRPTEDGKGKLMVKRITKNPPHAPTAIFVMKNLHGWHDGKDNGNIETDKPEVGFDMSA